MDYKILSNIKNFINEHEMVKEGDTVIAGLSGGADSVCLLLALCALKEELGISLEAVHVEHGIRGDESLRDQAFCTELCDRLGVKLTCCSVDIPAFAKAEHLSEEEAARIKRYGCYKETAMKHFGNVKIALAHHGDDAAETMLFNLVRGSGIRGLGSILPVVERDGYVIIRPLLCMDRADIVEALEKENQSFCIDSTNADTDYSRNRIRNVIMPELEKINSRASAHMNETALMLSQITAYLDRQIKNASDECVYYNVDREAFAIVASKALALDSVILNGMLLEAIGMAAGRKKDISSVHVDALSGLLRMPSGRSIDLPYNIRAKKIYDEVFLLKNEDENVDYDVELVIPGRTDLGDGRFINSEVIDFDGDMQKIPQETYAKWFDYDKIIRSLRIRNRREGDFLIVDEKGSRQTVKKYCVNSKIPADRRDKIMLVADESHVLWVVGHRISEGYKVTSDTRRVVILTLEDY